MSRAALELNRLRADYEALKAELAAVKKERSDLIKSTGEHITVRSEYLTRAETAESHLSEMEKEVERLRAWKIEAMAALRLLADAADANDEAGCDDPDEDRIWLVQAYGCRIADLTVDELRAARRLVEGGGK